MARRRSAIAMVRPPKAIRHWKPHPIQGWTPDFIPKLSGRCRRCEATIDHAYWLFPARRRSNAASRLAKEEGIFVGISSVATFAGALRIAAEADRRRVILCMLPGTGERYLSTPLFASGSVEMTPEGGGDHALHAGLSARRRGRETSSHALVGGLTCRSIRAIAPARSGRLRRGADRSCAARAPCLATVLVQ